MFPVYKVLYQDFSRMVLTGNSSPSIYSEVSPSVYKIFHFNNALNLNFVNALIASNSILVRNYFLIFLQRQTQNIITH